MDNHTLNLIRLQLKLEQCIQTLIQEFLAKPYQFFTEADAVTRFHQLLDTNPLLNSVLKTKDGYDTSLVHREYPTFFRFDDKNPTAQLNKGSRGHYDMAILNPIFVMSHSVETVKNRDIVYWLTTN